MSARFAFRDVGARFVFERTKLVRPMPIQFASRAAGGACLRSKSGAICSRVFYLEG